MREYVKVPLLHAHARMSLLVYLANAMPMDTTDRTMPMPARHQSRLASAMMSSPFYSFINEYITISIAFPSLTALLRRIPSIMKPFFSKNIIKFNNCYIFSEYFAEAFPLNMKTRRRHFSKSSCLLFAASATIALRRENAVRVNRD